MKSIKVCRVCGKEYEACHTTTKPGSGFRWQEVACSPTCGAEYLRRVTESRAGVTQTAKKTKAAKKAAAVEEISPAVVEAEDEAPSME